MICQKTRQMKRLSICSLARFSARIVDMDIPAGGWPGVILGSGNNAASQVVVKNVNAAFDVPTLKL